MTRDKLNKKKYNNNKYYCAPARNALVTKQIRGTVHRECTANWMKAGTDKSQYKITYLKKIMVRVDSPRATQKKKKEKKKKWKLHGLKWKKCNISHVLKRYLILNTKSIGVIDPEGPKKSKCNQTKKKRTSTQGKKDPTQMYNRQMT